MPVTYGGPSGKRLKDDDPRVTRHREILASHGMGDPYGGGSSPTPSSPMVSNPVSGVAAQAKKVLGGGGKGGRPDIDPSKVADSGYNKDERYGYYRPDGTYVSAFMDMRDGGGKNQSGNYFVGGGLVSSLLNAAKIRPAGAARERDPETGEYIVPREQIGYANFTDWMDRGGPQASGGKFQGLGGYSAAANMLYDLSGKDFGERVPYGSSAPAAPAPRGGGVSSGSAAVPAPTTGISIGQGNTTPLSYGDQRPPEAIGINEILLNRNRGFQPTISPLTAPAASVSNPNYATYVGNPVTQMEAPSMFSSGVNSTDLPPAYDPAMIGADKTTSTDLGRLRLDNLNTIPSEAVGTPAAEQYERYLMAGGKLLYPQYLRVQSLLGE